MRFCGSCEVFVFLHARWWFVSFKFFLFFIRESRSVVVGGGGRIISCGASLF